MVDSSQITFVLQGNIRPEIHMCISSIRKYFPKSKIIFSTWVGENISQIDCDEAVFNIDPGDSGNVFVSSDPKKRFHLNNLNRQIVSSYNGLKRVKTPYAIKFRPDFIFKSSSILKYYNQIEKLKLKRDDKYKMFQNRILMICAANAEVTKLAYHICDYIQMGHTEDLLDLWNIPQISYEEAQYCVIYDKIHPQKQRAYQFACEQQIWLKNLDKYNINYKKISIYHEIDKDIIEDSERIFLNNLYFIDYALADVRSPFDWMLNQKIRWTYRLQHYFDTYDKYFGTTFPIWYFNKICQFKKNYRLRRIKNG